GGSVPPQSLSLRTTLIVCCMAANRAKTDARKGTPKRKVRPEDTGDRYRDGSRRLMSNHRRAIHELSACRTLLSRRATPTDRKMSGASFQFIPRHFGRWSRAWKWVVTSLSALGSLAQGQEWQFGSDASGNLVMQAQETAGLPQILRQPQAQVVGPGALAS